MRSCNPSVRVREKCEDETVYLIVHTQQRKSCCALGVDRHRRRYVQERLCDQKASCVGFSCLSHSQSIDSCVNCRSLSGLVTRMLLSSPCDDARPGIFKGETAIVSRTLYSRGLMRGRTDGIAAWPLNRLRTRLSIPLGFLQLGSTHMNRSL